jgi:hypothetical protein
MSGAFIVVLIGKGWFVMPLRLVPDSGTNSDIFGGYFFHPDVRFQSSGGHVYLMRPENETFGASASAIEAPETQQYATRVEVEEGLNSLTEADYAKLMMIAKLFCRERRLAFSVCEPKELLNQAVLKTLECDEGKRWKKNISMVKHLDRAMENISGHLVRERMKIVAFPDGLKPGKDESKAYNPSEGGTEAAKVAALLKAVFGDDDNAKEVFVLRNEGFRPNEVQARLGISAQEYETVNRRILRKISLFATKAEN